MGALRPQTEAAAVNTKVSVFSSPPLSFSHPWHGPLLQQLSLSTKVVIWADFQIVFIAIAFPGSLYCSQALQMISSHNA